jgi:hypothetical protein
VCVHKTPDGKTATSEPKEEEKESEQQKPEMLSHRHGYFQYLGSFLKVDSSFASHADNAIVCYALLLTMLFV